MPRLGDAKRDFEMVMEHEREDGEHDEQSYRT